METYTVFIILLFPKLSSCQRSQVILYSYDGTQNISLSKSSDLRLYNFDNKVCYVRVSGLILFYKDPDFLGEMVYVFGGENWYGRLRSLDGQVSSVRYPGLLENITKESITLYNGRVFTGRDYVVAGSNFTGTESWTSLIVTGGNNWTVFDSPNFRGNAACLIAPNPVDKNPALLQNVLEIPSFGNAIKSGFKSCSVNPNQNHLHLTPFVRAR